MSWPSAVMLMPQGSSLPENDCATFRRVARARGLALHRLAGGALIATAGPAAVTRNAAVIGELFRSADGGSAAPRDVCAELDRGRTEIPPEPLWGPYLVLIGASPETPNRLYRAPFGELPCFWTTTGTHIVAATSPALLEAFAPARPGIDWRALAMYLLASEMRGPGTCLTGVRELPGGSVIEVGGGTHFVRQHWSPWSFAGSDRPIADLDEAADVVGSAIDRAVAARCRNLRNPVLLLSGGLDSSTLAAALAATGQGFSALTMVTRQKSGDERRYARAVADAIGAPLTESMRSVDAIDWDDTTPRGLARPSARLFRHPTFAAAGDLAHVTGASAIIDGGGGDNVFCSLQSVALLLDRLAVEGLARGTWATARDIALQAEVSIGSVLGKAAARRLSGRVAFRWQTDPSLLGAGARDLARHAGRHPWLDPPPQALPGQAAHVALVLGALSLAENDSIDPALRTVSPFVTQPVVEAALRVRSWLWFRDGRNRAVIRRRFARSLPGAVIGRGGKGTPAGFMREIVDAHRERLRGLLLDGLLTAQGVVDRAEIEAALSGSVQARDGRFARLLVIADAERWARLWR